MLFKVGLLFGVAAQFLLLAEDGALDGIARALHLGVTGFTFYTGLTALVWVLGGVAFGFTIPVALAIPVAFAFAFAVTLAIPLPLAVSITITITITIAVLIAIAGLIRIRVLGVVTAAYLDLGITWRGGSLLQKVPFQT